MPDNEAVDIARLQEQLKALRKDQEEDHKALEALQHDRDRALVWGILVLGSTVLSLGMWILKNILKVVS